MPPTLLENDITRENIEARQKYIDANIPTSVNTMIRPVNPEDPESKCGYIGWTTHTKPNNKTITFIEAFNADGSRVRPLSKKTTGNNFFTLPPAQTSMGRADPVGTGKFVKTDKNTGRFRYCFGLQQPGSEYFKDDIYVEFAKAYHAFDHAMNDALARHIALECNTDDIPITAVIPAYKEKWDAFKEKHKNDIETNNKAIKQKVYGRIFNKLKAEGMPEEEAKKTAKSKAKQEFTELLDEYDERLAREAFYEHLKGIIANKDDKSFPYTNMSILNAEVFTINFDLRNNPEKERRMSDEDKEQFAKLRALYPPVPDNPEQDALHGEQQRYIDLMEQQYKEALTGKNPITFNNEFTVTDSDGQPMTLIELIQHANFRGATAIFTIKTRPIDIKNIDGMRTMIHVDVSSIQIDVNGKSSTSGRPVVGSAAGFYGKHQSEEPPSAPTEPKKPRTEDPMPTE